MSKKVSDILPKTEILAQFAEEASELAQAALKLRRAAGRHEPDTEERGRVRSKPDGRNCRCDKCD